MTAGVKEVEEIEVIVEIEREEDQGRVIEARIEEKEVKDLKKTVIKIVDQTRIKNQENVSPEEAEEEKTSCLLKKQIN